MLLLLLLLLLLITTNVVVAAISLPAHTFKRLIILQKIQEGAATASAAVAAAKRTCEQCFMSILKPEQITRVLGPVSIARACATFDLETQIDFRNGLIDLGIPTKAADDLITCLLKAGSV
jgi:hypothetical protein